MWDYTCDNPVNSCIDEIMFVKWMRVNIVYNRLYTNKVMYSNMNIFKKSKNAASWSDPRLSAGFLFFILN